MSNATPLEKNTKETKMAFKECSHNFVLFEEKKNRIKILDIIASF